MLGRNLYGHVDMGIILQIDRIGQIYVGSRHVIIECLFIIRVLQRILEILLISGTGLMYISFIERGMNN